MQNFLRYKEIGFQLPSSTTAALTTTSIVNGSVVDWRYYIQSMIMRDPIDIRVITTPQKGMYPDGSAIRMQYYQNIEPRKIGWVVILHLVSAVIIYLLVYVLLLIQPIRYCKSSRLSSRSFVQTSRSSLSSWRMQRLRVMRLHSSFMDKIMQIKIEK